MSKFSDEAKRALLEGFGPDGPFEKVRSEVRIREDAIQITREAAGLFRVSHMWRGKEIMWERVTNFDIGTILTIPLNSAVDLTSAQH